MVIYQSATISICRSSSFRQLAGRGRNAELQGATEPRGDINDFIGIYENWKFDWIDVPAFIRSADTILEYPMVDQDPLARWSFGRITLLGDAAHPMYPRGSNGAGQAILDAKALADSLAQYKDPVAALQAYEAQRLEVTANVVRMNRRNPPDAILREVYLRTGDRPFTNIDEVISKDELSALDGYKRVAGYDQATLGAMRKPGRLETRGVVSANSSQSSRDLIDEALQLLRSSAAYRCASRSISRARAENMPVHLMRGGGALAYRQLNWWCWCRCTTANMR
jgi:hypothetical protein